MDSMQSFLKKTVTFSDNRVRPYACKATNRSETGNVHPLRAYFSPGTTLTEHIFRPAGMI